MLAEMVLEIRARDPDVIEGHNIFRFDLPYIDERARRYGVNLTVGRDGGVPRHRPARFQAGDRVIPYPNYEIHGRHVIDTWFLAQRYSQGNRELRKNGLKDVARHFGRGVPGPDLYPWRRGKLVLRSRSRTRFSVTPSTTSAKTREISAALSPGYYVQARIFPSRYQETALADDRTKIDWLMLREYLARRHSIPAPMAPEPVARKYAALKVRGVSRPVVHCDVTALVSGRRAGRRLRVEGGRTWGLSGIVCVGARACGNGSGSCPAPHRQGTPTVSSPRSGRDSRCCWTGSTSTWRFPPATSTTSVRRDHVTRAGGELIRGLAARLDQREGRVVTVDAGGIYFVPPAGPAGAPSAEALVAEAASSLPWKVELPLARYRAVFCYAPENHALLDERDELFVSGPELGGRGLERYRREWLEEMLRLLLQGRKGEIPALYEQYREAIANHRLGLSVLKRTETLRESLDDYQMKVKGGKQHPRGAYEVALRSGQTHLSGDQISYYVVGEGANVMVNENSRHVSEWDPASPDENVEYYKARLPRPLRAVQPLCLKGVNRGPGSFH